MPSQRPRWPTVGYSCSTAKTYQPGEAFNRTHCLTAGRLLTARSRGSDGAGDIVTLEQFDDFELVFDWRVADSGNSGVMFRVTEVIAPAWHSGPEFQVLHNQGHRDGADPITSAGSNYAVHPPARDVTRPVGEWNTARLLVDGQHVEHWMNGVQVLEYELESADWRRRVQASKFSALPKYGREPLGHIAIQDHGDPVAYRNVKIRRLARP